MWRDILQPLRGLGNILKGAAYLIVTPLLFLHDIVRASYYGITSNRLSTFTSLLGHLSFVRLFAGLFDGINNILRGALQVATTPLVLPRLLLRAAITAFRGMPTFEATQRGNAEKIEPLIAKKDKTLDDAIEIDLQMSRLFGKAVKAEKRGQAFVDKDELEEKASKYSMFTGSKTSMRELWFGTNKRTFYPKPYDSYAINNARHILGLFTGNGPNGQEIGIQKSTLPFVMRD